MPNVQHAIFPERAGRIINSRWSFRSRCSAPTLVRMVYTAPAVRIGSADAAPSRDDCLRTGFFFIREYFGRASGTPVLLVQESASRIHCFIAGFVQRMVPSCCMAAVKEGNAQILETLVHCCTLQQSFPLSPVATTVPSARRPTL